MFRTTSCLIVLAVFLVTAPATAEDASIAEPAPWSMYQGDASHTGYVPVSLDPADFSLRWQRSIGGRRLNPVTAADGKVFVSEYGRFDSGAGLHVLDAREGNTLWKTTFGRVNSVNPPSYDNGKVYIQTGKGTSGPAPLLHAFDADTGQLVFRSQFAAQWEKYYAPTHYDGKVYVNGGYYGGAYAFDGSDGRQLWSAGLNQYDQWTPAVDRDYVYAYVGSYSPGLYVLNRTTGSRAYSIPDPNFDWSGWSMNLAPVLGAEDDVLAIHDYRLISFDLQNRDIRWELADQFTGQPSLARGVIYAINSGELTAREESTGSFLWGWDPPGSANLTGTLIVTDSHVFAGTSNTTYAVDLSTREQVWSYPVSGHLALSNDSLLVAGADGRLTAFAVPEPSTLVLLGIGAVGLLGWAWRRRKRA